MSGSSSLVAKSTHEIPFSGSGTGTPAKTQRQQPGIDGSHAQRQGQGVERAADIVAINDDDDGVADEVTPGKGKRQKKCTSEVWNYFTKKNVVVKVNEKKYEQLIWGFCNFPNYNMKYRAECSNGTTGFRNHLKSSHNIVKGQLQLKAEKDNGKDVTTIQPYRYDQEASVKKNIWQ